MTQIFSAISQLQYFSKLRATSREGNPQVEVTKLAEQAGQGKLASRAGQGRAGQGRSPTQPHVGGADACLGGEVGKPRNIYK